MIHFLLPPQVLCIRFLGLFLLFSCCFCKISAMMRAVGFGHHRPGMLLGETRCPPGEHSVGIGRPEEPAGLGWGRMEGAAAILLPKGSLASFSQP